MARFRKIDVRTWGDERFQALSRPQPNGQSLWFYLLTNPDTTNIPGLYRAGEAGTAEALDWPLEAFREAFREVSSKGMAKADWKARVVWVPKAIQYNEPESPNVVRSWRSSWDEIPECDLKREAYQVLKAYCEAKGEGFREAFAQACRKPKANQEQEQEQEKSMGGGAPPALALAPPVEPEKPPPDPLELEFETAVKPLYPRRHGDYRWRQALGHFRAARRGGEPLDAIVRGVRGYAAFCERKGWLGTEKVKQAASFFGPEQCWREPWDTPQGAATGPPKGTIEWSECPTCGEALRRIIGETPPAHTCRRAEAAS